MKIPSCAPASLLAAVILAPAAAIEFPRYAAERIQMPRAFRAGAVNAAGDVVGIKLVEFGDFLDDCDFSRVRATDAFRQTADGTRTLFHDLPGGVHKSALVDLNDDGLAVGYASGPHVSTDRYGHCGRQAMAIGRDGGVIDLAAMLPAGYASTAVAVNRGGQVIGNYFRHQSPGFGYQKSAPFLWHPDGRMQLPFPMRKDFHGTTFAAINDLGHVAGIYDGAPGDVGLFVWDPQRGTLHREMRMRAKGVVNAINNHDEVVSMDFNAKPFVWKPPAGRVLLPDELGDGRRRHNCEAKDIDDTGTIVGYCKNRDVYGRNYAIPVIWQPDARGRYTAAELTERVEPPFDFPRQRGGAMALHIDESGRILVQAGSHRGGPGPAFMLTPIVDTAR